MKKGFSLIEILVVLVIIVVLSSVLTGVYLGSKGGSKIDDGKAHSPMQRAKDTVCLENIHSVRISIAAAHASDTEEKFPGSLSELRELGSQLRACPVGKEPYEYDPTSGQVKCVHPGHANY